LAAVRALGDLIIPHSPEHVPAAPVMQPSVKRQPEQRRPKQLRHRQDFISVAASYIGLSKALKPSLLDRIGAKPYFPADKLALKLDDC
jgi:hypothetical protein